jgi:Txe/YoeB family toxin of Txe-Axe toxin-antitoxin module/acyl-CoA-binding protein
MDSLSLSDRAWPKDSSQESDGAGKPARKTAANKGQAGGLFARARRIPAQLHSKKWIFSRESTRVAAEIPVTVRGIEEGGHIFSEETHTLDVSKRGAKIASSTLLAIGTYLWIESPKIQSPTVARVVRHGTQQNGVFEICVTLPEVEETDSIWNIESPPNDWKSGPEQPTAARRLERIYARDWVTKFESLTKAPTLPPEVAGESDPSLDTPSAFGRTATADSEYKMQPGKILEFVMGEPATPAQAIGTTIGRSEERPYSPSDQMRATAASDVEIRLAKLTVAMESLEGRVGALVENFQGRIDSSLQAFQGNGAKQAEELEKAARELAGRWSLQFQEQAEAALAKLREEVKNSGQAVEQGKQQLASLAEAKLASLSQTTQDEYAQRLAQALSEQTQEMHAAADGELNSIRQAAAEAIAQLQGKLQEQAQAAVATLREELKTSSQSVEQSKHQLASLAEAKLASLNQATQDEYAQRLAQSLREQTQEMRAAADGEVKSIREAAAEAIAQLQGKLEQQAQGAVATLQEELRSSIQAVEQSKQQLDSLADAKLASLSQATRDEYAQRLAQALREQTQEMHAAADGEAQSIRQAAAEAVSQLQSNLQGEAEAAVAMLREELKTSSQAVEASRQLLVSLAEAKLASLNQATQDEYAQRLAQALREQTQEMHAAADGEVKSIRQAAGEAVAQLQSKLQDQANAVVATLHEELRNSSEAVEQSKQQLASLAEAKLASLSQASQDEYAQRLARALREQTQEMHAAADGEVDSIRRAAAEAIAHLQNKLQEEAEAAVAILREELKNSSQAAEESKQQLASLAEAKLASLSQTTRDEYAQRLGQALSEQTQEMHAAADDEMQSIRQAAAEAIATLREELKNSSEGLEASKQQLASLAEVKLASLSQATQDEYARRLAQALREQTQQMQVAADGEVNCIKNAAAEAIAQLKAVEQVRESDLLARAEAAEERLTGVKSAVEALQGRVGALAEDFQEQHAAKKGDLEGIAQQLGARWSQQLQEQAAAAVEALHTRMSALAEDFQVTQARKAEDLERVSGELEGKWSQQIQEQAKAAVDALQGRAGALADEIAAKLSKKAEDWERIAPELEGQWSRRLQEQAEAAVEQLREEVKNSSQAVEETKKQLSSLALTGLAPAGQVSQEDSGQQVAAALREQAEQIQAAADAEVRAIKQAAQDAIAEAQAAGQAREEDFLARTGVAEERLKAVSLAVESLTESVQGGGALHAVDLDNVAQELGNRMTEQFEKQTELAVDKVRAEVRNAGRAMEELAKQLSGLAETKRAALNQVVSNAAAGFEAQQRKLRMQFESERKELEDLAARRMAKLSVGSMHSAREPDRKGLIVKLAIGAGLFLIMVASLLAVSLSTHTVMQLRNDAPAEFVDDNPTWNAKRRSREQEVAQAYWRAAAVTLEAKYPYGSDLPAEPPDDFQVDNTYAPAGGAKALADLRQHYWDKTREAWHQHAFWVEIQEPDTTWSARFHHTLEKITGK